MPMNLFPYTNFHELNLDWVIAQIKTINQTKTETAGYAQEAKLYRDAAQVQASNALASANTANQAMNNALDSATAALQSAGNAAASASQAQQYAENIGDPVAGIVTQWLQSHVDPATGYVIDNTLTIAGAAADAKAAGDAIRTTNAVINDAIDFTASKNLIDQNALISGYYVNQINGELVASETQAVTPMIPVSDNLVLSTNAYNLNATLRYAFYNSNGGFVSGASAAVIDDGVLNGRYYKAIALPANATQIRLSGSITGLWNGGFEIQLEEGNTPTEYIPYGAVDSTIKTSALPDNLANYINDVITPKKYRSYTEAENLADTEYLLTDNSTALKKGEVITFAGNITTFNNLMIGWTLSTPNVAKVRYIEINNTNIIVHGQTNNGSVILTYAHGLTITVNIAVKLVVNHNSINIMVISNGEKFSVSADCFKSVQGFTFALSDGSTLTGCRLSWACTDINTKVWMFGDSYFGMTNPARWMYYLQEDGYTNNALIDGYAGRASNNAVLSLSALIALNKPDFIVWCMGMNDGSDSENTPSAAWTAGRDYVLNICSRYGITPVFATIPSVPTINHDQLNDWIRLSGYRYIDFAFAVGNTAAWYPGMLAPDNVHPTEKGARALYGQFLTDFPEITIKD